MIEHEQNERGRIEFDEKSGAAKAYKGTWRQSKEVPRAHCQDCLLRYI